MFPIPHISYFTKHKRCKMTIEVFYYQRNKVLKIKCQKWGLVASKRGLDFVAIGAFDSRAFPYDRLILISGSKLDWDKSIDGNQSEF